MQVQIALSHTITTGGTMYEMTVLDNGLRVLSRRMPHTMSASICVYVGSGSRYEDESQAGISHYVEHMLFKGTTRRPTSIDISGAIEGIGGMINGSTDRELCSYWCKVALPHFLEGRDVRMDMVFHPLFDAAEVENERTVIQEELGMSNDHPSYRVDMLIDDMMWPNQPLGRDVGGSKESVQNLTREMLVDHFTRQYVPSNMVVSVAGDLSHDQVLEAIAPRVEDRSDGTPMPWHRAVANDHAGPQVRVEHRKTEQAHLCFGLPGIATSHPDRYALDMMNTVLGEGMSSRLFAEVRERQGLAYDIHSSVSHFRDTGSIIVYSGVDPKKAIRTVSTILTELERMKEGVPQEELNRGRELAKGRLLLRMEDTRAVAAWAGAQEMLHDRVLTVEDVVEKVNAVTTDDLKQVANRFLLPEKQSLAVVGPFRSDRRFQNLLKV